MEPRRSQPNRVPAALFISALATAARRRAFYEWSAGGLRASRLDRLRSPNLIATPRDFRPTEPDVGRAILAGRFILAGATLESGPGGDPWDCPSPSRVFAVRLHRFDWAPHLLACGEAGAREGLRLFLDWRRLFYRPNRFVWSGEIVERRLYNLTCGAKRLVSVASDAEAAVLFNALLHHARFLSRLNDGPSRMAERFAVSALAVASLNGGKAERLTAKRLARLAKTLPHAVLPDGGVRTRSPQAGLELLFDLLTLDDLLLQRGRETPVAVTRAIDRLGSALRFFTLGDGRLAGFQGGASVEPERVRAAMSGEEDDAPPPAQAPHSGYQRLSGASLQVILDAAAPAKEAWSVAACAQPLALSVVCGRDAMFSNTGWSPEANGPPSYRLTSGGSTAELDGRSAGTPLAGWLADVLGPRLVGAGWKVQVSRNENEVGRWLDLSHDGWAHRFGVIHERRVYVDGQGDELRGEDAFPPAGPAGPTRPIPYAIRFHVHPEVQVSIARDGRSVLLRGASNRGWWFRNDAAVVALEPSMHFEHGLTRRSVQVVLKGEIRPGLAARVRWKLTPVEPTPPKAAVRSRPAKADPVKPQGEAEPTAAPYPEPAQAASAKTAPEHEPEPETDPAPAPAHAQDDGRQDETPSL